MYAMPMYIVMTQEYYLPIFLSIATSDKKLYSTKKTAYQHNYDFFLLRTAKILNKENLHIVAVYIIRISMI